MKVKIVRIEDNTLVDAEIIEAKKAKVILPSVVDGWRFNFGRHSKKKGFQTYVLVQEDTLEIVEGCLIYKLDNDVQPYMAFIEVAPHNQGKNKRYEKVAGCLIAYACRLSFGVEDEVYNGWLAFDVIEEDKENEIKLMAMYSTKYNALKYGDTTMVIPPVGGQKLIDEFLNNEA